MASETWRARGKCLIDNETPLKHDPNFFPEVGNKADMRSRAKAKCFACPVRRDCLEWSLALEGNADANHRYGITGGLDPAERAAEHRNRRNEERNNAAS